MARPSKLTPGLQAAFVEAMASGCTFETAADFLELDVATVRRWLARGELEAPGGRYARFRAVVHQAKAKAVMGLLEAAHLRIKSKAEGGQGADPLPLLAILDRRYAPAVRQQVTLELTGVLDRLEVAFAGEPETWERVLSAIAEAGDGC
jgi:hypothetical protein